MQAKVDFGGTKPAPWSLKYLVFPEIDFGTAHKWTK
jgi:hypothetical protein